MDQGQCPSNDPAEILDISSDIRRVGLEESLILQSASRKVKFGRGMDFTVESHGRYGCMRLPQFLGDIEALFGEAIVVTSQCPRCCGNPGRSRKFTSRVVFCEHPSVIAST